VILLIKVIHMFSAEPLKRISKDLDLYMAAKGYVNLWDSTLKY